MMITLKKVFVPVLLATTQSAEGVKIKESALQNAYLPTVDYERSLFRSGIDEQARKSPAAWRRDARVMSP